MVLRLIALRVIAQIMDKEIIYAMYLVLCRCEFQIYRKINAVMSKTVAQPSITLKLSPQKCCSSG